MVADWSSGYTSISSVVISNQKCKKIEFGSTTYKLCQ